MSDALSGSCHAHLYRNFKRTFFSGLSNIAGRVGCQSSFCLMKTLVLLRPARAAQRSEAREVCRITPLARTQRERRRRLALATGFRLLRSSGLDRIAAQGSVAGRGWAGPGGRGFHRRIFDGGPSTRLRTGDDLQAAAAVRAVFDVDVEDPFEQPGPAHA